MAVLIESNGVRVVANLHGQDNSGAALLRCLAGLEVEGDLLIGFGSCIGGDRNTNWRFGVGDVRSRLGTSLELLEVAASGGDDFGDQGAGIDKGVFGIRVIHRQSAVAVLIERDSVRVVANFNGQDNSGAALLRCLAGLEVESDFLIGFGGCVGSHCDNNRSLSISNHRSTGRAGQISRFEVAAGDLSNGRGQGTGVVVDIIAIGVRHDQGAFATGIHGHGVVGTTDINSQGHGAAGLRRIAQLEVEGDIGVAFLRG
ncbi:hypothetical protein PS627_04517 [Pseudomonas fluorescens]|nr:hypothetical protein PS627_04517 [Pseudomonas fluorescens]